RQVLNHRVGTALAEIVVVFRAAYRVGAAFHGDDVALGRGDTGRELVELFLRLLGQVVLVESEQNRSIGDGTIIIEIDDGVGEQVDALHGLVRHRLGIIRLLACGEGLLVYFSRFGLHSLNACLGALIDILDVARILGGQVVKFIRLVDEWRGLLANVVLARAANRGGERSSQRQGQGNTIHWFEGSFLNRAVRLQNLGSSPCDCSQIAVKHGQCQSFDIGKTCNSLLFYCLSTAGRKFPQFGRAITSQTVEILYG